MPAFTAVDLARLPPPQAVQQIDFETIYASMTADLVLLGVDFDAFVESDPVVAILQLCAYREMRLRAEQNDSARSVMPALATGGNLDHIATRYFVQRLVITPVDTQAGTPAVMEKDDDLRRRMMLAFEGFSTAGPEGAYIFHALSAHPGVQDASATSPVPGQVVVTVLARDGDGTPTAEILGAVTATLRDEDVRPLTDLVLVSGPSIISYSISMTIFTLSGPGAQVVIETATQRVQTFVAETRRLGRDITLSALYAAAHIEGVYRVVIASPAADILCGRNEAANCLGVVVTHGGVNE